MDDEIVAILRLIRNRRNGYAPIYTLPTEILQEIFARAISVKRYRDNDFGARATSSLAAVCQRWWFAAKADGSLWSNIIVTTWGQKTKLLPLYLSRSKTARLTLRLGGSSSIYADTELFQVISKHVDRVEQLVLHASHLSLLEAEGSSNLSLPSVLSLAIQFPCSEGVNVLTGRLPRILMGELPTLRKLALDYYTSWEGQPFKNLTSLTLSDSSLSGRLVPKMTLSSFLDLLEWSPLLKELSIENRIFALHGASQDRLVKLEYLQRILLKECDIKSVLDHLDVPPADIGIINSVTFAERRRIPFQSDILYSIPHRALSIKTLQNVQSCEIRVENSNKKLSIDIFADPSARFVIRKEFRLEGIDMVGLVLLALPSKGLLVNVTALTVEFGEGSGYVDEVSDYEAKWTALFKYLQRLERLSLTKLPSTDIFAALLAVQGEGSPLVCPTLHLLRWVTPKGLLTEELENWLQQLTKLITCRGEGPAISSPITQLFIKQPEEQGSWGLGLLEYASEWCRSGVQELEVYIGDAKVELNL